MKQFFDKVTFDLSALVTKRYSTSFSKGIGYLHPELQHPIQAIYGFVRFADEIVDSFHDFDKHELLENFRQETRKAIEQKISLNPILHSFQLTVNNYQLPYELIERFFDSMEMDLSRTVYNQVDYQTYILGSAEVVGLMCLKVFTSKADDEQLYDQLKPFAMKLGAAFQKINFLRDIKSDYYQLGRVYFPNLEIEQLDNASKKLIEKDISQDFEEALIGIKQLPKSSRLGVYIAYLYYFSLFKKIQKLDSKVILSERVRISNFKKTLLVMKAKINVK